MGIIKILLRFCLPDSNKFLPHNYKITKFFSHAPTDVEKKILPHVNIASYNIQESYTSDKRTLTQPWQCS